MEERINKVIAASGIASRRGAEELIKAGKVIVDGHKITDLATKVNPASRITVSGKVLPHVQTVTYMVNKPTGFVTSTARQDGEKIVTDLVPLYPHVVPVGRLDKDSEGLLLLTNDGDLANRLTHPSFEHKKEYRVLCQPEKDVALTPESLAAKLSKGVKLGDGKAIADKAEAKVLPDGSFIVYLTVHEGRTHLVRRMCATLGLDVLSLRRTGLAGLTLGNLKPGRCRLLTSAELNRLRP